MADVAFLDDTLYAVVAGGGCSHGHTGYPSGIAKVNRTTGAWSLIADVGAWLKSHPAAVENPGDFEPDGTLYSMIPVGDALYTVEPNHGQVLSVSKSGAIGQVDPYFGLRGPHRSNLDRGILRTALCGQPVSLCHQSRHVSGHDYR